MAGNYRKTEDLPQVIPVFPLDGALLLPGGALPLQIFEPRYLNMIDDVMSGDRLIGMVQTRPGGERTRPRLARVGCAGRITSYSETGDGRYLITLTGICRFEVGEELPTPTPYRQVRADYGLFAEDLKEDPDEVEFERAPFLTLLRRYLDQRGLGIEWEAVNVAPAPALINSLSMLLPFDPAEKQALLEAPGLDERRAALSTLLEIDAGLWSDDDDDEPPSLQ
ncbi:MAG: LON peptidase substrate-binding domain-containing protein [Proteobacteria bacterium]|nr:LON peptidase substrate-binding domain-containing protein [Pseudomonadota bacterium]